MTDEEIRAGIINLCRECSTSTLITQTSEGHPRARIMEDHNVGEDLIFWLATSADTRKVDEIRRNPHTGLMYYEESGAYVYVLAQGAICTDPDQRARHFREDWYQYWPEGPESDDYVLLRFEPVSIEYRPGQEMGYEIIIWQPEQ